MIWWGALSYTLIQTIYLALGLFTWNSKGYDFHINASFLTSVRS